MPAYAKMMQLPQTFAVVGCRKVQSDIVCLFTPVAFLARSSMSMMSWVSHDRFSLKPCWRSYKIPCPSRCLTMFEAMMCSSTLQRMQVGEIIHFRKCLSLTCLSQSPVVCPGWCQKADHQLFSSPARTL